MESEATASLTVSPYIARHRPKHSAAIAVPCNQPVPAAATIVSQRTRNGRQHVTCASPDIRNVVERSSPAPTAHCATLHALTPRDRAFIRRLTLDRPRVCRLGRPSPRPTTTGSTRRSLVTLCVHEWPVAIHTPDGFSNCKCSFVGSI